MTPHIKLLIYLPIAAAVTGMGVLGSLVIHEWKLEQPYIFFFHAALIIFLLLFVVMPLMVLLAGAESMAKKVAQYEYELGLYD